jgi:hypothetical protein
MSERPDKVTLFWEGQRGKTTREVNLTLDIRDFEGRPGYVWLFLAANTHLSYDAMVLWLGLQKWKGAERSRSWLQRRRWLFEPPDKVNNTGVKQNADGRDARAMTIMQEYPTMSARALSRLLKERGINRSKNWVLRNRCR